jgi:hypothetical protein
MPLQPPPTPARLRDLPARSLAGTTLHRIYRRQRTTCWWFASLPPDSEAREHGRFDLPAPDGSCYLATSALAAVLQAFQDFGRGVLPDAELRRRRLGTVQVPAGTPRAAHLTAARARGLGVSAALWAGEDRTLTQAWAQALRRAGWQLLHHGIQHDPTGRLRGVTIFDRAGEHPPYDDVDGWWHTDQDLHDDDELRVALARYGIHVTRSDPSLPVVSLDDSDLV